jgi:hypothetical protein
MLRSNKMCSRHRLHNAAAPGGCSMCNAQRKAIDHANCEWCGIDPQTITPAVYTFTIERDGQIVGRVRLCKVCAKRGVTFDSEHGVDAHD